MGCCHVFAILTMGCHVFATLIMGCHVLAYRHKQGWHAPLKNERPESATRQAFAPLGTAHRKSSSSLGSTTHSLICGRPGALLPSFIS